MNAVDSSVAIRALLRDSEQHREALAVIARKPSLPEHAALETYSVLTRLADPDRVAPEVAAALIRDNFVGRILPSIPPRSLGGWLQRLAAAGISGGAIYDASIAETARLAGATLVTADRRAASTYRAVGVEVRMLGE